ncbi:amino acid adenylation domain-containing protein [Paenibacillus haidiansis]
MRIDKNNVEDIFALSPLQEGMVFQFINETSEHTNIIQFSVTIHGALDVNKFHEAWKHVFNNNEVLRTIFRWEGIQKPVQIVLKHTEMDFEYTNVSDEEAVNRQILIEQIKTRAKNAIDIRFKPIVIRLCKTSMDKYEMIITNHHILYDGWSNSIILNEFIDSYCQLYHGQPLTTTHKNKYKSFIKQIEQCDKEKSDKYWEQYFNGFSEKTSLPKIKGTANSSISVNHVKYTFTEEETNLIHAYLKTHKISLATLFFSAWGILLQKYNDTDDVVFGTTVSGRNVALKGIDNMVGLFINTIPLRIMAKDDDTIENLFQNVSNMLLEREQYEHTPLVKIKHHSRMTDNLFDSIVVVENYPLDINKLQNNILTAESFRIDENNGFDLTLMVTLIHSIEITLMYRGEVFEREIVNALMNHLVNIIKQMLENSLTRISSIDLLSNDEKNKILFTFNDTKAELSNDETLHKLFEKQVQTTPNKVAVLYNDAKLTYNELNNKANQLARRLRQLGIKEGSVVCIMTDRSFEMMIGLMAILKSGGAYLPLSKDYPAERIDYILKDSGAQVLLADIGTPYFDHSGIDFMDLSDEANYLGDASNLETDSNGNSLAYILYTSGSTGKPKGVMVEHYTVINYIKFRQRKCPIGERDVILQKTTYTFDVSVWELFWWSFYGASVCMLKPEAEKEPKEIIEAVYKYRVTMMHFVPSMLGTFLEYVRHDLDGEKVKSLRYVFSSGEALLMQHVNLFNELLYKKYDIKLVNLYGPTEATIDVTYYECFSDHDLDKVPIGKPIDNVKLLVLDKHLNLVPVGVKGELFISGHCLARGYFNNPGLTSEKFIENPYLPGYKMYKSGDLVRWLPDGNIEYFGRKDNQVKIRGFRIELEEIRTHILQIEGIREAVVLVREKDSGDNYLCAYYATDADIDLLHIKKQLKNVLPGYMIPSYFVKMEKLPIGLNGKMNTKALPEPDNAFPAAHKYIEPRNEIEEKLCLAFQEILGINKVGIRDDFFDLGGDSIKAIQIASWLNNHQLSVQVKDILRHPAIEDLYDFIVVKDNTEPAQMISGEFQLSPIQKWFFEKDFENMNHWNQFVILNSKTKLEKETIIKVFNKIIEHHDTLRIKFSRRNGKYIQAYGEVGTEYYNFKVIDLTQSSDLEDAMKKETDKIQGMVDIEKGPAIQLGLFKTAYGDRLLIVIHHLLVDGISWRIIIEDFINGYQKVSSNTPFYLDSKTDSYKKWVETINDNNVRKSCMKDLSYWQKIESVETNRLPMDRSNKDNKSYNSDTIEVELSEKDTFDFVKNANKAYRTNSEDLLLAALGIALAKWINSDGKFKINMEGHGREEVSDHVNVTRTIGWFTSIYPVLLDINMNKHLSYIIKSVKENLRNVPNHGFSYNVLKYSGDSENGEREIITVSNTDTISFNYLGEFTLTAPCDWLDTSNINAGLSVSPASERVYDLEIYGMIIDKKLTFTFSYNKEAIDPIQLKKLIDYFIGSLEEIKQHCINKKHMELTAYDLGCTGLDIDEFDTLIGNFKDNVSKIYSLSPMQEGIMYHTMLSNRKDIYCEQITFDLVGDVDLALLEMSLNKITERHESLRTRFVYEGLSAPQQVVLTQSKSHIHKERLLSLHEHEQINYIEEFIKNDRERGFDLSKDQLFRISILQTAPSVCKIVFCYHHIIMDGWSCGIVLNELYQTYESLKNQKQLNLPSAPSYGNYIKWLDNRNKVEANSFWKEYLDKYEYENILSRFGKSKGQNRYKESHYSGYINSNLTEKLNSFAASNKITLNTILNTTWGIMLQRYNNTEDVTFGTVVSGRFPEVPSVNNMVGLFINTVPVRVTCNSNEQFVQVLTQIQNDTINRDEFSYYPLTEIQNSSKLKQNLIDHIVVLENYPFDNHIFLKGEAGIKFTNITSLGLTSYDLNVVFIPNDNRLQVRYEYNEFVYDRAFVNDLHNHYICIIEQIIDHPEVKVNELKLDSFMKNESVADDLETADFDF